MNQASTNPLAVVTGASSGIGYHLAQCCAAEGFNLVIASDEAAIETAANQLRRYGISVETVQADLAARDGVDKLVSALRGRYIWALMANAGHGLGGGFLDQEFGDIQHVINTNVSGTLYLLHRLGRTMRAQGSGRILITGSIAGFQPGTYAAVYNASKAFVDSFAAALRNELQDSGISVSCLLPGVTDTHFFERAAMLDTRLAADPNKADPAEVARVGFDAMMNEKADVVVGLKNKLEVAVMKVLPSNIAARQHRKKAEPGGAKTK